MSVSREQWLAFTPRQKREAQKAVFEAVKAGELVREPCEVCGEKKVCGHHDDYNKPLEVRWLCQSCHARHHATRKAYERKPRATKRKIVPWFVRALHLGRVLGMTEAETLAFGREHKFPRPFSLTPGGRTPGWPYEKLPTWVRKKIMEPEEKPRQSGGANNRLSRTKRY